MPVPMLQKFSDETGIPLDDAERYWEEAKDKATEQGFKEGSDRFYAYVVGIVKKRMKMENDEMDEESMAAITTTSVGNSSTLGGAANFANRVGTNRKVEKKKEEKWKTFVKNYTR